MKTGIAFIVALAAALAGGAAGIVQDQCGPFTDVTPGFCPYVLELYYLGITVGTSATTFSPDDPLTRGQGAVFIAKGLNQFLARSSRRAALGEWWTTTPHYDIGLGLTSVGDNAYLVISDGADLWVANGIDVARVRASDGKLLEAWNGAVGSTSVMSAMGRILVTGATNPDGSLYMIDPSQPAGTVTTVANNLGSLPLDIAFDGSRVWTANFSSSISIVTPAATLPWPVTTVTTGFVGPRGILYDGQNIWVTDETAGSLLKLDSSGAILQTVTTGGQPGFAVFDGANIWVPNLGSDSLTVVRASTGDVLGSLVGNGLQFPLSAAFDGQRILITNYGGSTVSLWQAADLTPLGFFTTGAGTIPYGACSDGVSFWITLFGQPGELARF